MMSEYQEMKGEDVIDDDDENHPPISVQTYWGRRKIFESYNSWYYGDQLPLHPVAYQAYDLTYLERIQLLFGFSPTREVFSGAERPADEVGAERPTAVSLPVERSSTATKLQITVS